MTIVVQEFDGSFSHSIVVDDFYTVHDLPCHSKLKKCVCMCLGVCVRACVRARVCMYLCVHVRVCVRVCL